MKISIYVIAESNGSPYVKIPLKFSALLNIKNVDKYCFTWYFLVKLHPISDRKKDSPQKFQFLDNTLMN